MRRGQGCTAKQRSKRTFILILEPLTLPCDIPKPHRVVPKICKSVNHGVSN
uniref:Uncharacterized protein n=1 Tax=Anguilla anguilla TaxID=7936 RepID=A0A0E9VUD9_ANGAN